MNTREIPLSEALVEVSSGVGAAWSNYRVLGATRAGLALAREPVGKSPERYKLVEPGTIFYNPMRIMIGSIAMVEDGEEAGITSPDYVVFRTRPGVLHHRWFYYWLRSKYGEDLIRSLARGAVRERLLFRRLVRSAIVVPDWEEQVAVAKQLLTAAGVVRAVTDGWCAACDLKLAYLSEIFESDEAARWPKKPLGKLLSSPLKTGISKPASPDANKLCLTLSAVVNGELDCRQIKSSLVSDGEAEGNWIKPGAFYVVRGNGNLALVGRGAICPTDAPRVLYPDLLIEVVPDSSRLLPRFLSAAWNSPGVRQDIEARCRTTNGIHKINQGNLARVKIPCPDDVITQERVVRTLEGKLRNALHLKEELDDVRATTLRLQSTLLRPSPPSDF